MTIKIKWMLFLFLIVFITSGCKEITYTEQVPYQVEETYYVDEPYEVNVPYTEMEDYYVNESYHIPIKLDLSGNEIKPLEIVEHKTDLDGGTCVAQSKIYNPNNARIFFNIEYVFDISISNPKSNRFNQTIDKFGTYNLVERGNKPYWLSNCDSVNIESESTSFLDSPDVNDTFKTEWHMVTKQREITKYKKEIRTRQIPKTRTVTKYKERLVTEKKLLWQ